MLVLTIAMASCTSCGRLVGTGHTAFCPSAKDLLRREAEAEVAKAVRADNFASTTVSSLSGYGIAKLDRFESQARGFQHGHLLKARGEAELHSLLNTSKTDGRSLETVAPAAVVRDGQSLDPAVPELSTASLFQLNYIEVAAPVPASIQAANDVTAATPSDADADLLDDDNQLMDADSVELCVHCENCGHRPAAWELGGHECWECFREH